MFATFVKENQFGIEVETFGLRDKACLPWVRHSLLALGKKKFQTTSKTFVRKTVGIKPGSQN